MTGFDSSNETISVAGVDNGDDLDETELKNIYNKIKTNELTTKDDHTTHVLKVLYIVLAFVHCSLELKLVYIC